LFQKIRHVCLGVGGKVFVRIQHENPVVAGFSKELLADTVRPGER
jgi:hypothetical protein